MPRVIAPPLTPPEQVEMLERELGAVTHVTEEEELERVFDLIEFGRRIIRYRKVHGLIVYRYFVVRCQCEEVYLVRAGAKGGSWRGKCMTCGTKADRAKGTAEVIEEVI